jgi:hypothetical protein
MTVGIKERLVDIEAALTRAEEILDATIARVAAVKERLTAVEQRVAGTEQLIDQHLIEQGLEESGLTSSLEETRT